MDDYNRQIEAELAKSVWARTPKSWYKTELGRIRNNWSGSTIRALVDDASLRRGALHEEVRRPVPVALAPPSGDDSRAVAA
jgi:hypothetical protein